MIDKRTEILETYVLLFSNNLVIWLLTFLSFACLANDYVDLPLGFLTQATELRLILIPWGGVLGNGFGKEVRLCALKQNVADIQ